MSLRQCVFAIAVLTNINSQAAWARGSKTVLTDTLDKIEAFQKNFPGKSTGCKLPDKPSCDLESLCSAVVPNRKSAYLYGASEGPNMPNFNLVYANEMAFACLKPEAAQAFQALKKDPFLFPEILDNPENAEARKKYEAAEVRAEKIFVDVKKRITALLLRRKNTKNANEIQSMLDRIESVKISRIQKFSIEGLAEANCSLPNAAYHGDGDLGNKIVVCPQFLNLPEATLYQVLAHELAHSFDPCVASLSLTEMKSSSGASSYSITPPGLDLSDSAAAAQNGPMKYRTIASGIVPAKNPFHDTIQCLQSKESIGHPLDSLETRRSKLETEIADFEETHNQQEREENEKLTALNRRLRDLDEDEATLGYCADAAVPVEGPKDLAENEKADNRRLLQESFADAISAEVSANKAAEFKDPAEAKKWAFESNLFGLQQECVGFEQNQQQALVAAFNQKKCDTKFIEASFGRKNREVKKTHAGWSERMSRIHMAPAATQKALGCQPKNPVKHCL